MQASINLLPSVSIIMPVYNEAGYIRTSLESVLAQSYPGVIELIIADGLSNDGTRQVIAAIQQENKIKPIELIDNPKRIVPIGLNCAIKKARGEVIVRMDAHCEYPKDYVLRVVDLLITTGADNAGGVLVPYGDTYTSKAISAAYYSPIGIGEGQKGHKQTHFLTHAETVWGGCWRRQRLIDLGLFDEKMVRNQDDELNFRLRKNGGFIAQDSSIQVIYFVRDSYRKLFAQFAQYGYWKIPVIFKHPAQSHIRHFLPALFYLMLIILSVVSLFWHPLIIAVMLLIGFYVMVVLIAVMIEAKWAGWIYFPGILLAIICIHAGYGLGSIYGFVRKLLGPLPVDKLFRQVTR
jgi:succinoglycan biosynthesis protein ExoA